VDAINAINAELEALAAEHVITDAAIEALSAKIEAIEASLNVLNFAKINSMITEISFDFAYDDYNRFRAIEYSTTTEVVNYEFATGIKNAITFKEGQRLASQAQKVLVKVSPANADLSKMLDKISLVRSDSNTEINDFVKPIKAERANPLLVRSSLPTATGLWYVSFELSQTASIDDLVELTSGDGVALDYGVEYDDNGLYLFAMAIENTIDAADDAEERFIISDFVITIETSEEFERASKLSYLVDETSVEEINNRATDSSKSLNEEGITYKELVWTDKAQPTQTTTNTEQGDDRSDKDVYPAVQGVPMTIKLTGADVESIRAMYVTLDYKVNAIESAPSEWNSWKSYDYTGLDEVVIGTEVEINITNESAINDVIGFRVFAVNYDGTLVDPDGKAFYVSLGVEGENWGTVNTVVTPESEIVDAVSAVATTTLTTVTGAKSFDWDTDEDENGVNPAFQIELVDASGTALFSSDGGDITTLNIANVKGVRAIPTALSWLAYEDNKVYNGTLLVKNATNHVIATLKVTFKKVLPTTAPSGFSVKTSQIASDGVYYSYLIPDDWEAPNATQGTMDLGQVFNFTGDALAAVDNFDVIFADAAKSGANIVDLTVNPGDGLLSVAKEFVDNTTEHETTVVYNYGEISTALAAGEDYVIEVEKFPTVFSNIYNSTYSWRWATRADLGLAPTDPLPYSTNVEYGAVVDIDLAHIQGISSRDALYNATLDDPYEASLQVISAKLVSDSNGLAEYFDVTPDPLEGDTVFKLTEKSGSTNPTADVASTLILTAKDMYGNDVEIKLPMTVLKR
jgi:hypothetical protein